MSVCLSSVHQQCLWSVLVFSLKLSLTTSLMLLKMRTVLIVCLTKLISLFFFLLCIKQVVRLFFPFKTPTMRGLVSEAFSLWFRWRNCPTVKRELTCIYQKTNLVCTSEVEPSFLLRRQTSRQHTGTHTNHTSSSPYKCFIDTISNYVMNCFLVDLILWVWS